MPEQPKPGARSACIECVMAWLLYGDGAICLYHQERVFSKGCKG